MLSPYLILLPRKQMLPLLEDTVLTHPKKRLEEQVTNTWCCSTHRYIYLKPLFHSQTYMAIWDFHQFRKG